MSLANCNESQTEIQQKTTGKIEIENYNSEKSHGKPGRFELNINNRKIIAQL